ncbi:hypothetical protein Tco_0594235 [Tanacetum coccineum]
MLDEGCSINQPTIQSTTPHQGHNPSFITYTSTCHHLLPQANIPKADAKRAPGRGYMDYLLHPDPGVIMEREGFTYQERERLAYEQEGMETRQALARSEAHCRTLEAQVTVLETEARRHEWQRQAADELAVQTYHATKAWRLGAPLTHWRHCLLSITVDCLVNEENCTNESHKVKPEVPTSYTTPNETPPPPLLRHNFQALIDQDLLDAMAK